MEPEPEPERRRRRPAVSCILCRKRKIRCDRATPCSNCAKSKPATCSYRDPPLPRAVGAHPDPPAASPPPRSRRPQQGSFGDTRSRQTRAPERGSDVTTSLNAPLTPNPDFSRCHTIAPPPRQVAASSAPSSANTPVSTFTRTSRVETQTVNISGNFYFHSEHRLASEAGAVTRSVTHKTRLFGQSHSLNDIFEVMEHQLHNDKSGAFQTEQRCKALARVIKARRAPPWPCTPTPDLPAMLVANGLVDCYLKSSETVLRVLHIPSFRRDYDAVWDRSKTPDPAFLVLLKLVMAIGATSYDSTFSLRTSATRWVYEAQTWLSAPEFKSRLGIRALQNSILLLIAREATGVGDDMVWATAGLTLRVAMYMGLHRDPAGLGPKTTTPLVAEMRRRLWNTVLELLVQASLNSGGPPLISADDFDTEPPGNFDDDQLTGAVGEDPVPRPDDQFTQTTIAIAVRNMFPQRLAIAKYLNDLSSCGTYAETIKLDTELRDAFKTLTRTLQAFKALPARGPSDLELLLVDLLVRRYFLSLHLPFFAPALKESAFAFSRRVVVESALHVWRAAFPLPISTSSRSRIVDSPFLRLATSGSGYFRTVVLQGFIAIAVELKALLREEESLGLGPVALRPDLLLALQDFKIWSWERMKAGETSTKGYIIPAIVHARLEALRKGLGEEAAVEDMMRATDEAGHRCLALLEEAEAETRPPHEAPAVGMDLDGVRGGFEMTPGLGVEDWDYMVSCGDNLDFYVGRLTGDRCRMRCLTQLLRTLVAGPGCFSSGLGK
ncbi:Acetamidase regulatory protein [Staphylotrichum tortipilum]|uniref:Acetamidase regulatory protein n=1 Tax=Staphylotrichum tortipilum TaxID=2831512 RepID=A0AAN6MQX1_9PEZI|nr:Acetamidase regulatory protein [Staphylotrichum longicolle]